MNWLTRLGRAIFGRFRPSGTDFYDLAERVPRVPDAEMAVAEAALANGGPIADRLLRQLRAAGHVWRLIADDGCYELRISTTDDLAVPNVPRSGWTSEWIPVAASDARRLELRVLVDSGIVGLLGRTADGRPWPRDWRPRPADVDAVRAKAPWIRLPTPDELRASRVSAAVTIATWLGDEDALRGRRGVVRAHPPATDETVVAFAAREAFALPEAYESLVRRADGIEVGGIVVLGTRDAYRLDMPGPPRLVVAPPNEDGALTLGESGEVRWVDLGDVTSEGRILAPDLRQWVKQQLIRKTRNQSQGSGAGPKQTT